MRSGTSAPFPSPSISTIWGVCTVRGCPVIPVTLCALAIDGGTGSWPSPMVLLAIAYITIVPMGVGNVVWFAIVGLLPAHLAGLSTILVPVVAMVSGAIVHGEPLGPLQLLAMGCFVAALALALLFPSAAKA